MAGPPAICVFFNLPDAKNPTDLLSGDQNGNVPPSVPASTRGVDEARGRTQIMGVFFKEATKASSRPSGDTANCGVVPGNDEPSGAGTSNSIGGLGAGLSRR